MTVSVLEWSDPPAPEHNTPSDEWDALVTELRSRPGQWARVAEGLTSGGVSHCRRRMKERGCEVRQHRTGPNRLDVYARWIDEQEPS